MKNMNRFFVNAVFNAIITYFILLCARGNPIGSTPQSSVEDSSTIRQALNSDDYSTVENVTKNLNCDSVAYELNDVIFLENDDLFLKTKNVSVHSSEYQRKNGTVFVCISHANETANSSVLNCRDKFEYERHEYTILENKSAIVDDEIVPEVEYELRGDILLICVTDEDEPTGLTLKDFSIYVGQVGSGISIISLILHLLTFVILPTLRNLPGYNLASLSIAFLLAYCFVLIGQIPEVLGLSCVISAVLQQNFFLVAFFCMNVLAFDVWRTLKLATEKLVVGSRNTRRRQFIWYSMYAWGVPLLITSISVIVDNADGVPSKFKPGYGKNDVCWMSDPTSKAIFFAVPAFTLLVINAIFFLSSSWMISSNTMKVTKDQTKQTVKLNYVLYVRLALMMGLTWLVGIIAFVSKSEVIWFIFDLLNSLQGLFLFLLFTCTKKVMKQLMEKTSNIKLTSVKQTTLTSNSSSVSLKTDKDVTKPSRKSLNPFQIGFFFNAKS